MSSSPGAPVTASPPFDHVKADAILRSSDSIDFRVFKLFLTLASPVFETLFNHPQLPEKTSTAVETNDELPVIRISEDSRMLDSLLRFCYPCTLADDPTLKDFRQVINVLEAAKRYSLDGISRTVRKPLPSPKILEANSLGCFAIACHYRMPEECILAAKLCCTANQVQSSSRYRSGYLATRVSVEVKRALVTVRARPLSAQRRMWPNDRATLLKNSPPVITATRRDTRRKGDVLYVPSKVPKTNGTLLEIAVDTAVGHGESG